jgi:ectoine hydroxylase-related dioxygenase (phytanoyl-CoA dioxygenase family)
MRPFDPADYDVDEVVSELLDGKGAVVFPGLFSADEVAEAREVIMRESQDAPKVAHFQGAAEQEGTFHLQRRVWALLAKGAVFSRMAENEVFVDVMRAFLGTDFVMGSIAANRIMPGGPGQEPHIDYPYWDFHRPESFPTRINASFPMNAQATIPLDPFTEESGATAYLPGSQKELRYPTPEDDFFGRCERMLGDPGDGVIFYGTAWHCSMPNRSDHDRSGVLIEYLPKFVKPVEDMHAALDDAFYAQMSPTMRQLLGFDYEYPQNLEEAEARNAEGTS